MVLATGRQWLVRLLEKHPDSIHLDLFAAVTDNKWRPFVGEKP